MDIFAMLRHFFLFKIIIVKYRKVVNAAERRTRDHDKWGMLPLYPYLFRAGGFAARLYAGVLCRNHPTFKKLNAVFVVGGLGFDDEKGIKSIISRALCETPVNDCKKLKNENGDDGYVVRAANQILILLPDEPEQIESIMQGPLRKYIMANSVMQ